MRIRGLASCLALVAIAGCGSDSPTAPTVTAPTYPNVAGNYSGSVTFTFVGLSSSSCPATTTITQSGNLINVSPLILSETCGGLAIP